MADLGWYAGHRVSHSDQFVCLELQIQEDTAPASKGWLMFLFSKCWQDIDGEFWDPVLVRVEDNEEEECRAWTSTSWAGCFDPESWSRPGWSLRSERRRRTPEEDRRTFLWCHGDSLLFLRHSGWRQTLSPGLCLMRCLVMKLDATLSFLSQRNLSLWALLCMKTPSRWPVSTERISMAFSPQPMIWLERM